MKLFIFLFNLFCLLIITNSYKLLQKPTESKEDGAIKYEGALREEDKNVIGGSVDDSPERNGNLLSEDETDGGGDGVDKKDLEEAKRKMLEEIRNIKSVLKRKFQTFFSQVDVQLKKKEFCPLYMSEGADWRKMIREASSLATLLTKAFLGPLGGAQVLGIKAISAIANIGKTDEPSIHSTESTLDHSRSRNSAADNPKTIESESESEYARRNNSSSANSSEFGDLRNRKYGQEYTNMKVSTESKGHIKEDVEEYERGAVQFSDVVNDVNAFEVLAEVAGDYCNSML